MKEKEIEVYGNKWKKVNPASPYDITSIENELKVTFPENLKFLFQRCAGGYPEKNFYENFENDIEVSVGYILPIEKEKRNNFLTVYRQLIDNHDLPSYLIPFAQDTGNANQFCIDTRTGEVIYWLHDEPKEHIRKVSNSLQEFLDGLSEPPF